MSRPLSIRTVADRLRSKPGRFVPQQRSTGRITMKNESKLCCCWESARSPRWATGASALAKSTPRPVAVRAAAVGGAEVGGVLSGRPGGILRRSERRTRSTARPRSSSSSRAASTPAGTFTNRTTRRSCWPGRCWRPARARRRRSRSARGRITCQPTTVHRTQCLGPGECLAYIFEEGRFSFTPTTEDGKPLPPQGKPPAATTAAK